MARMVVYVGGTSGTRAPYSKDTPLGEGEKVYHGKPFECEDKRADFLTKNCAGNFVYADENETQELKPEANEKPATAKRKPGA